MFDTTDPRANLPSTATTSLPEGVDLIQSFEMGALAPDLHDSPGPRRWSVRGATFVVTYSAAEAAEEEQWADVGDESILVVADPEAHLVVTTPAETITIREPSVVILPPGDHSVTAHSASTYVRVVPDHGQDGVPTPRNKDFYATVRPEIDRLPAPQPELSSGRAAVHPLSALVPEPGRFGRIFRSHSLMVNLLEPEDGPRDPDKLSPHLHETFEQCSVTLHGDYTHHLRVPWTPKMSQWRPDEHLVCTSPSITIIPPGMIHTTGGIGDGHHLMMDVFAPPRADFLAMDGWVVNAADY